MKKQQITKKQKEVMLDLLNNIEWLALRHLYVDESIKLLREMLQKIEVEN